MITARLCAAVTLAGVLLATPAHASAPQRPNPDLTPGVIATSDPAVFCRSGYSGVHRHTSAKTKRAVYRAYGIAPSGDYEVDHLVPLSLGGADVAANLWPQSYVSTPFNAHVKDRLETRLLRLVCHGTLAPEQAQEDIRTDWIAAFRRYCAGGVCVRQKRVAHGAD